MQPRLLRALQRWKDYENVIFASDSCRSLDYMMMPGTQRAEANQVMLDPGKSGELVGQFAKTGKVDLACLQPAHMEAGMMGKVSVR